MKLNLSVLSSFIELPECDKANPGASPLRQLLDDLGLEVKGLEVKNGELIFTIETLANRGDHLYALGVAREISARTLAQISLPSVASSLSEKKAAVPIRRNTDLCHNYALLDMTLPVPMPLRSDVAAVLQEDGGRHHAIVDLINYVQLELGQPMHAFDYSKIDGEVIVDTATQEETVEALDGKTYKVPTGSILIRDKKKIIAVAGVIGCANSMVTDATQRILVEAATFDPVSVRKTARAMGISTDASYAFERGSDSEGIPLALKRLVYLAGGAAGAVGGSSSAHVLGYTYTEKPASEKRKIKIKLSTIRRQMNLPRLEEVEVTARLKNLGYQLELSNLEKNDKELSLTVPSWRTWDVFAPEDIVEDVARSFSLNRVKQELPALDYEAPPYNAVEDTYRLTTSALTGHGFFEVVTKGTYSQSEVNLVVKLNPKLADEHVCIKNALEANNSHLKVTNAVHLANLIESNRRMGVLSAKVFEISRLFRKPSEKVSGDYEFERDVLTFAAGGRWNDSEWRKPESLEEMAARFTGVVADVIRAFGHQMTVGQSDNEMLHPGIQGSIKIGRAIVGFFGALNPLIAQHAGTKDQIFYAEIDLADLLRVKASEDVGAYSDFPSIRRDITLMIPPREQAGKLIRYINEVNPSNLSSINILDDFRKPEEEFRRVTYRLTFQSVERTLQHAEVDAAMSSILEALKEKHGMGIAE